MSQRSSRPSSPPYNLQVLPNDTTTTTNQLAAVTLRQPSSSPSNPNTATNRLSAPNIESLVQNEYYTADNATTDQSSFSSNSCNTIRICVRDTRMARCCPSTGQHLRATTSPSPSCSPGLRARVAQTYLAEYLADVWFTLHYDGDELDQKRDERLPAHTYVLSIGSSVFHTMFHGNFAAQHEIDIPDVQPNAFKEMLRNNLEPTTTNQRRALGDIIYLIRFAAMSIEDFANGPAKLDILDAKVGKRKGYTLIITFLPSPGKSRHIHAYDGDRTAGHAIRERRAHRITNAQSASVPKQCISVTQYPFYAPTFQSNSSRSNQWRYRGRCDSIQFSCDHRIFVAGLAFYGSNIKGAKYRVGLLRRRKSTAKY
ncbi:unnamed protein product [Sphagnum balticum]